MDVKDALDLFHPGRIVEIRALNVPYKGRGVTVSGYFDDHRLAAEEAAKLDALRAEGIYFNLNEVHPGLLSRSPNRITFNPQRTTGDRDIVRVRWALIDIDPVRPSGISATAEEIHAAKPVAREVLKFLRSFYGDGRKIVRAFSGNGFHILTEIVNDHEAFEETTLLLSDTYSTPSVKVDVSVTKRAQLTKLYGTFSRKGFELNGRSHRRSYVIDDEI